jgi:hypothetical protein
MMCAKTMPNVVVGTGIRLRHGRNEPIPEDEVLDFRLATMNRDH